MTSRTDWTTRSGTSEMLRRLCTFCAIGSLNLACEAIPAEQIIETDDGATTVVVDSISTDPAKTVCDPFANNNTHLGYALNHGIQATLSYIPSGSPNPARIADFAARATAVDATLFMDEINVPTRPFDLGFVNQNGDTIVNQSGNTLYENFSVTMNSELILTERDSDGPYQFMLLADDGATLEIDRGSGFELLINNDGTHPTKAINSTSAIYLDHQRSLPIRVTYYQGPRYHISVVLMWRPFPTAGQAINDPLNGQQGNSLFWDSTLRPSAPQTAYTDLVSRGWKVVSAFNYQLPASIANNPCQSALPPGVSQTCGRGTFTPKSAIRVGLSIDSADPAYASIVANLQSLGFSPTVYSRAQVEANLPATDGITALVVSRVVTQTANTAAYSAALHTYVNSGGSLITEYDGSGLLFDSVVGSSTILSNMVSLAEFFTGQVSGGGPLLPVQNSRIYVQDPSDPIMQGVAPSYLSGVTSAFGVTGYNASWLHEAATFNSSGTGTSAPAGTYSAVLDGQCGNGRVVIFNMTTFNKIGTAAAVDTLVRNAFHWVTGI